MVLDWLIDGWLVVYKRIVILTGEPMKPWIRTYLDGVADVVIVFTVVRKEEWMDGLRL